MNWQIVFDYLFVFDISSLILANISNTSIIGHRSALLVLGDSIALIVFLLNCLLIFWILIEENVSQGWTVEQMNSVV